MSKLCETYDYAIEKGAAFDERNPLPELGFKLEKVQLIVSLTSDSEFFDVETVSSEKQTIPVPATPDSILARGAPVQPHPIFDKVKELGTSLQLGILAEWCSDPDVPEDVKVIYHYLQKNSLCSDITKAAEEKQIKLKGGAEKSFVCIKVNRNLWFERDFIDSWKKQFSRLCKKCEKGICYATGVNTDIAYKHPFASGTAMLVSMSDENCDGRFKSVAGNAVSIGINTTLKAHGARRWLMNRQGKYIFGMELVSWDTKNFEAPQIFENFDGDDEPDEIDTGEEASKKVAQATGGVWSKRIAELDSYSFEELSTIVVMAIDSATGKGRVSIVYYQEFDPHEYLSHLLNWYNNCVFSRYDPSVKRISRFTPTLFEVYGLIYGKLNTENIKKLKKQLCKELIPCIVTEKPLPQSIINAGYGKAVNPFSFCEKNGKWNRYEWEKAVCILCALLNKKDKEKGKEISMILDENETNRDYLYGRLLAIADTIEQLASKDSDKQRETNAIRYMQRFSQRPDETWEMLRAEKLRPYLNKLEPGQRNYYERLLCAVQSKLTAEDYSGKPLGPRFLQGYSCQKMFRKTETPSEQTNIEE